MKLPCIGEKSRDLVCRILLLDDAEFPIETKSTCKGQGLLDQIFDHLNLIERDYFGLRYLDSQNQNHWLEPLKNIGSQLKNGSHHILYFGVKFYAADPCKLHEEVTRYQFFLQIKRDMLQGRLPVPFETAAELAAFAVQSELGDFDSKRHSVGYVSEFRFIPNQNEELEARITMLHRSLVGLVPAAAEYKFLDKAKWLEMFGVDLHPVQGDGNMEYFVGLTPTGIVVYRNKAKVGNYFWPRISKVNFKGNMFIIRVKDKNNEDNTYAFECSSKQACKHLWKCCIEHHAFFRLNQAHNSINSNAKTLSSKHRYSGRTEKEVQEASSSRSQPQVVRSSSRKHERRYSYDGSQANNANMNGTVTAVVQPEPVNLMSSMRSSYSMPAPDSPRSTRSAPWEMGGGRKGGLYTSGQGSPRSVRSEMFPVQRRPSHHSGSDGEGGGHHRRRHHRRDYEYDSDGSSRRRRRRQRNVDSGSESEASYRHHSRHRHSRRSADNLAYSDARWQEKNSRAWDSSKRDFFGNELRPNASISSMPEAVANNRRRRRRSKSPGNRLPPQELAAHFRYVEPQQGMSMEQLQQIPYTAVETKADPKFRNSPHSKRQRSPRRRSYGEQQDKSHMSRNHREQPYGMSEHHKMTQPPADALLPPEPIQTAPEQQPLPVPIPGEEAPPPYSPGPHPPQIIQQYRAQPPRVSQDNWNQQTRNPRSKNMSQSGALPLLNDQGAGSSYVPSAISHQQPLSENRLNLLQTYQQSYQEPSQPDYRQYVEAEQYHIPDALQPPVIQGATHMREDSGLGAENNEPLGDSPNQPQVANQSSHQQPLCLDQGLSDGPADKTGVKMQYMDDTTLEAVDNSLVASNMASNPANVQSASFHRDPSTLASPFNQKSGGNTPNLPNLSSINTDANNLSSVNPPLPPAISPYPPGRTPTMPQSNELRPPALTPYMYGSPQLHMPNNRSISIDSPNGSHVQPNQDFHTNETPIMLNEMRNSPRGVQNSNAMYVHPPEMTNNNNDARSKRFSSPRAFNDMMTEV